MHLFNKSKFEKSMASLFFYRGYLSSTRRRKEKEEDVLKIMDDCPNQKEEYLKKIMKACTKRRSDVS